VPGDPKRASPGEGAASFNSSRRVDPSQPGLGSIQSEVDGEIIHYVPAPAGTFVLFLKATASGVTPDWCKAGANRSGAWTWQRRQPIGRAALYLVAGAGFEPATFRL
jgi:hypothetical protein